MPPLSLLIKPASGLCDLRCKYCFYANVTDQREVKSFGIMTAETTEKLVEQALAYEPTQITFAFQGGEPTLAGLDYFTHFIESVTALNQAKVPIHYALQTNGMHLDESWAQIFRAHKFLVGISLDGPKAIHDLNRIDAKGSGSFHRVRKSIALLEKYEVDFNILTVVTKGVAKHAQKVYQYFMNEGYHYLQFIPCLDELDAPYGKDPYALLPKNYGDFLCRLFDLWYMDYKKGTRVSIRMFDNILQMLLGMPPESCDMTGRCSANLVIEADGSAYPCDFYVLDQWRLGSVYDTSLRDMQDSETARDFVALSLDRDPECEACPYLNICRGGCRRHRSQDLDQPLHLNYFCPAYKQFYAYTLDRFKEIATVLYREMNTGR